MHHRFQSPANVGDRMLGNGCAHTIDGGTEAWGLQLLCLQSEASEPVEQLIIVKVAILSFSKASCARMKV